MRAAVAISLAVMVTGLIAGSAAVLGPRAPAKPQSIAPVWTEAKWPFVIDQWGTGRAFVCAQADCGVKVDVYVRPKIGFCNCSTGVSDDAELERVADNELVSRSFRPSGPSQPVKVGWMKGLWRTYVAGDRGGERLLSIAFNDQCDVVVALASLGDGDPAVIEAAVADFLNTTPMVLWAKKELGLEFIQRVW